MTKREAFAPLIVGSVTIARIPGRRWSQYDQWSAETIHYCACAPSKADGWILVEASGRHIGFLAANEAASGWYQKVRFESMPDCRRLGVLHASASPLASLDGTALAPVSG